MKAPAPLDPILRWLSRISTRLVTTVGTLRVNGKARTINALNIQYTNQLLLELKEVLFMRF